MYDPDFSKYGRGSFAGPVPVPTGPALDSPIVCVEIAAVWLPYITGALSQLAAPTTWITDTDVALWDILGKVQDLITAIGEAGACMVAGTQALTVTAGNATAAIGVLFPMPFTAPPVVVVSESTGSLIASVETVAATGFTARLTANVATSIDMPSLVSWVARVAP